MILTEVMIDRAVALLKPSAEAILNADGTTWGPKWVIGFVRGPGINDVLFEFGNDSSWNSEWGTYSEFRTIAEYKLGLAHEQKMATSTIVALRPWVIEPNEYLYAGAVHAHGITVAISGARGRVDEGLADALLCIIMMLAYLETDERIANKEMRMK